MKISTKGRYGLRILVDLAMHDPARPRLLRDIAQSQQISEKYISRLVLDLRRAKLIRSVRGINGGFHLMKPPEEITLLEILETMEGPISVVGCVHSPEKCKRHELCPTRDIWVNALFLGLAKIVRKNAVEEVSLDIKRECEEAKQNFTMTLKDLNKAECMVKKLSQENAKLISLVETLRQQICEMVSKSYILVQS